MFDRRTYPAIQSRFIPPIYGLQVAVAGCGEFQGIEGCLNTYIRRRYGNDAIAYSRMVLEGEVYTVVLKDWATTSRLLSDPFEFFSDTSIPRFISISQPILLYLLNSAGVPLNPAFLSRSSPFTSPDQRSVQAQIDALRQQGLETVHTFSDVVKQQHAMIMELHSQGDHVMSAVSMVASSVSTSAQLSSVENQLGRLHDRRAQLEDKLILAPEPNAHQYIQSCIHSIDEETHELNDRAAHLHRGLQALTLHVDTTLRLLPTPAAEHSTAQSSSQSSSGHLRPEINSDEQQRYQPRPRMTPSPPGPQPDGMQTETPHAWIINETKSPQPQASRIRVNRYNTFEEPGLPLSTGHSRKWGVILGIKRSIHAQRIPTPSQLRGRAVILDAIIPTVDGHGFPHRIIGLYAPWDPGENEQQLSSFWPAISELCSQVWYSWCVIGDCNASVSMTETLSSTPSISAAQRHYTDFLHMAQVIDLWTLQGDADANTNYTFSSHIGRSIIDRVAYSTQGILTGTIEIADTFIPATDHRAIWASLILTPPLPHATSVRFCEPPPFDQPKCFYYPQQHEKHRFATFANAVDSLVQNDSLHSSQVTDDTSFNTRYNALTLIFQRAAEEAFEQL
ncbi:hypothetical protein BKA93DRAFT_830635 [Sparassis latifolia]